MDDGWLTYEEVAVRLGVTPRAARARAFRGRWSKMQGNDGRARVRLPDERPAPARVTTVRPTDPVLVDALRAHVETLKAEIETLKGQLAAAEERTTASEARVTAAEARADREMAKAERAIAEFSALAERLAALAEERSRPLAATHGLSDEEPSLRASCNLDKRINYSVNSVNDAAHIPKRRDGVDSTRLVQIPDNI